MNRLIHHSIRWLGLEGYSAQALRADALSAMTVAIIAIPQSMAYALIAGVHPMYGLYATIVTSIVGALFGSSNHLITGPTNATALMVAGAMKRYAGIDDELSMICLLTFLAGAVRLALGLLRFGRIVNFVSQSVVLGFTAGAAVIIALGQIPDVLGVQLPHGYHPLYRKVILSASLAGQANLYALGLAALTVLVAMGCRRLDRRIPGALIALTVCAVLSATLGLGERGVHLVGDLGRIPPHLPPFTPVVFDGEWIRSLWPAALAIALVGLTEATAISKAIALSSGQRIDPSREFVGQGLANMAGAFFLAFPCSGSFTRSAINYSSGARTRLSGVLSGVWVALILLLLAEEAQYIPTASLAGIIVLVAAGMINWPAIARMGRTNRHDLTVVGLTAGATILMPDLEKAILAGIGVSILIHVWGTGRISMKLLEPHGAGFREVGADRCRARAVALVHLDGDLYFGCSADLQEKLQDVIVRLQPRACVIRLKRVHAMDISALQVLEAFVDRAGAEGRHVLLCGLSPQMHALFREIGLVRKLGEDNVFEAEPALYASTLKAWHRAVELIGDPSAPGYVI